MKLVKIKSIKKYGYGKALDINMQKNHNFILANGILTHNTNEAQAMLRELTEIYEANCKFVFTANYANKIIEPLKSRCILIEYGKLNKQDIKTHLEKILKAENVDYEPEIIDVIINKYYPDLRSMINKLEELSLAKTKLIASMVSADDDAISLIYDLIKQKKFTDVRKKFFDSNYEAEFLLNALFNAALKDNYLDNNKKLGFIDAIGETLFRMSLSVDKEVQVSCGIARMMRVL